MRSKVDSFEGGSYECEGFRGRLSFFLYIKKLYGIGYLGKITSYFVTKRIFVFLMCIGKKYGYLIGSHIGSHIYLILQYFAVCGNGFIGIVIYCE